MNILNSTYYQNLVIPVENHKHTYFELHYITIGNTDFNLQGTLFPIRPGTFFWTIPGEKHFMIINRKMKPVSQYAFNVEFTKEDSDLRAALEKKFLSNRFPYIGIGHRTLFEQIRNNSLSSDTLLRSAARHKLYAFLFQFSVESTPNTFTENQYIESALQIMQSQFPQPIKIDLLCQQLGVSNSYLNRIFNETMGEPPLRYYLTLRLQSAKHLLQNSNLKVKEIANKLGFSDELYFSKLFKKWHGMSPTQCAMN